MQSDASGRDSQSDGVSSWIKNFIETAKFYMEHQNVCAIAGDSAIVFQKQMIMISENRLHVVHYDV